MSAFPHIQVQVGKPRAATHWFWLSQRGLVLALMLALMMVMGMTSAMAVAYTGSNPAPGSGTITVKDAILVVNQGGIY